MNYTLPNTGAVGLATGGTGVGVAGYFAESSWLFMLGMALLVLGLMLYSTGKHKFSPWSRNGQELKAVDLPEYPGNRSLAGGDKVQPESSQLSWMRRLRSRRG